MYVEDFSVSTYTMNKARWTILVIWIGFNDFSRQDCLLYFIWCNIPFDQFFKCMKCKSMSVITNSFLYNGNLKFHLNPPVHKSSK